MSDLISRKKVIDLLYQVFEKHSMATDKNSPLGGFGLELFKSIKEIPTAYDVDKIMETYGCHDCEQADTMACNECPVLEVLNNICEIVKQGDVSDDVCEWIKYDYRTICPKNHDANNPYWRIPDNTDKLKYCPYCGKKIKIVGD